MHYKLRASLYLSPPLPRRPPTQPKKLTVAERAGVEHRARLGAARLQLAAGHARRRLRAQRVGADAQVRRHALVGALGVVAVGGGLRQVAVVAALVVAGERVGRDLGEAVVKVLGRAAGERGCCVEDVYVVCSWVLVCMVRGFVRV
jgi:hypothetical protein